MTYHDRNGLPITPAEWTRLYRARSYSIVQESAGKANGVVTSWIGLRVDGEPADVRGLFVVEHLRLIVSGNQSDWQVVDSLWCEDEASAATAHELIISRLGIATTAKPSEAT